ncbi:AAA family ATPase [Myxococcota bacterium]|nr:AAA family ATPase [Myxococcota bacterium]
MTLRIAIASQKGGVGKTTVALNLGLAFAELGRRVLIVDLDPQGGVGLSLGRGDSELPGLIDLMMDQISPEDAVVRTKLDTLALLPRGRLDPVDIREYEKALDTSGVLHNVLASVEAEFDIVVIDTPSGLGMVTHSALAVSDYVLVPFLAQPLTIRSVFQLTRVIDEIRITENPKLKLLGFLPTMVEMNDEHSVGVLTEIWSGFSGVIETVIPRAPVFSRASAEGVPVAYLGGAVSPEARRFEILATELDRMIYKDGTDTSDGVREKRQLL